MIPCPILFNCLIANYFLFGNLILVSFIESEVFANGKFFLLFWFCCLMLTAASKKSPEQCLQNSKQNRHVKEQMRS